MEEGPRLPWGGCGLEPGEVPKGVTWEGGMSLGRAHEMDIVRQQFVSGSSEAPAHYCPGRPLPVGTPLEWNHSLSQRCQ